VQYPGAGAVRIRVADLNGDGLPELIIARGFDNATRVMNSWIYWGSRDGWDERFHIELSTPYVEDVCVADLNRDGVVDLAIGACCQGTDVSYGAFFTAIGKGDGTFAVAKAFGLEATRCDTPDQLTPAFEGAFASGQPTLVEVTTARDAAGPFVPGWWDFPVPAYIQDERQSEYWEERAEEQHL